MKLKKKIIRKNYDRVEPKYDWLKYWRVVRRWATTTYNISYADLEMLLFLYSEDLFSELDFERYERIMSWDSGRFKRLFKEEWIKAWREKTKDEKALYTLSHKGKRLMNSIYKKLSGEEEIPTDHRYNAIFKKDAGYMDRGYQRMILKMNEAIRKARGE